MAVQAAGEPAIDPWGCWWDLVIPGPAQTMPSTSESPGEMPEFLCWLLAPPSPPSRCPPAIPASLALQSCLRVPRHHHSLTKEREFVTHRRPLAAAPSQRVTWVPDTPPRAFTAAAPRCCPHVLGQHQLPAGRSLPRTRDRRGSLSAVAFLQAPRLSFWCPSYYFPAH